MWPSDPPINHVNEFFDQVPVPLLVVETDSYRFLKVNSAAVEEYGYSQAEFKRMNIFDLVQKEDVSRVKQQIRESGPSEWLFEDGFSRHLNKRSEVFEVQMKSRELIFKGKTAALLAVIDITESERRFRALVQDASDLLAIIDVDANYLYVSPSCTGILGIRPEEFIGNNAIDFIHPEDQPRARRYLKALKTQPQINLPSYRFKHKTQGWCWLETKLTDLRNDPAVGGIVANSRDITRQREAKQQLRLSNERFQLALKVSNEMIWEWDHLTGEVTRGLGYESRMGYKSVEKEGCENSWFSRIHPDDFEDVCTSVKESVANPTKSEWRKEYRILKTDGDIAYVTDRAIILRDEKGKALKSIGAVLDVTESRKHLREIEDQYKALQEISWIQSHVVRAPLVRIMGLMEMLNEDENFASANALWISSLKSSATELDEIIKEIVRRSSRLNQDKPGRDK